MSQEGIFTVAPYLSAALALFGIGWRIAGPPEIGRPAGRGPTGLRPWPAGASRVWKLGMLVVLAGHVVSLLLPQQLLAWNQHPVRLLVLETTGLAFASLAVAGLAIGVRASLAKSPHQAPTMADAVVVTLLAIVLSSGIGVALLHRWGSSWAAVTVVPYIYSVLRLDPEPSWMASLPFLVRLHALSSLALVAAWPFSSSGRWLVRWRERLSSSMAGREQLSTGG